MLMSILLAVAIISGMAPTEDRPCVLVVVGAPGNPEYKSMFNQWAEQWRHAAQSAGADLIQVGQSTESGTTDHERLRLSLANQPLEGLQPIWIVLLGHGTHDGHEAEIQSARPGCHRPRALGMAHAVQTAGRFDQLCRGERPFYQSAVARKPRGDHSDQERLRDQLRSLWPIPG